MNGRMKEEMIRKRVFEVIRESTETEEEISEDTLRYEDMGLASVEVYVMLCDLEEEFGITIPAASLREIRTAGDLCRLVGGILD